MRQAPSPRSPQSNVALARQLPIATAPQWSRANWREHDQELMLSGTLVLRFHRDGRVVDHVDYWVESLGRRVSFTSWGTPGTRP